MVALNTQTFRDRHGLKNSEPVDVAVAPLDFFKQSEPKGSEAPGFEGIATSAAIDVEDEVVQPEGLDWSYFKKFRAMYPNHDYAATPVAKLRSVSPKDDGWLVKAAWIESNPAAREMRAVATELGVMGMSIGFQVVEGGEPTDEEVKQYGPHTFTVRRAKVLEVSPTFMPANPTAIVGMKNGNTALPEAHRAGITRLLSRGVVSKNTAKSLGVENTGQTIVLLGD